MKKVWYQQKKSSNQNKKSDNISKKNVEIQVKKTNDISKNRKKCRNTSKNK